MSTIAMLPDDLLCYILQMVAGSSIWRKFAVAQVSAHWRRLALSSPLLWTQIRLSRRPDCRKLALVLERCGSCAPLEIYVSVAPWYTIDGATLESAMRALESYAHRIRVLVTDTTSNALLNSVLDFPALHTLRVCAVDVPPQIQLSAPGLRVLELANVSPLRLTDMLSQQLEAVSIDSCPNVQHADLLTLLVRCPHVEHLTFRSSETEVTVQRDAHWNSVRTHSLHYLQTLDLCLPAPLILKVLDSAVLPMAVTVALPYGHVARDSTILSALLLRMGPVTHFALDDESSVTFSDDSGHSRTMALVNGLPWDVAGIWQRLGQVCRARDTVCHITVLLYLWEMFARDLAAVHPHSVARTLRVLVSHNDVALFEHDIANWKDASELAVLGKVAFPQLARIEFAAEDTDPPARLPARLVLHVLQAIIHDEERAIDVDIDSELADFEETRDLLAREARGRWRLVI